MSVRTLTLLAAGVLSAAMLGCRDGTSPGQVSGTWVLERIGDDPVPSVIFRQGGTTVRILADTLRLGTAGRGRFVRIQAIVDADGNPSPAGPSRLETALRYTVHLSTVEIFYVCPINALCTAGPHLIGLRNGDRMFVEDALVPEDVRFYRRVGSSGN